MLYEDEREFRKPTEIEHKKILKSEWKWAIERILYVVIFALIMITPILTVYMSVSSASDDAEQKIEQSAFTETEESIIKEIYGDRKAYADRKTKDKKKNFIDKKKSKKKGRTIYKEKEFQEYYDSFLEEYDKRIDKNLVQARLELKKQEMVSSLISDNAQKKSNRRDVFWSFMLWTIPLLCIGIGLAVWRLIATMREDYEIIGAYISDKRSGRWGYGHLAIIRRRAVVSYCTGEKQVLMTILQTLGVSVGERVYLIRYNNIKFFGFHLYSLCKM